MFCLWDFFARAEAGGLSPATYWQHISSGLTVFKYSGQSRESYNLNGFDSPTYFHFLHSFLQTLRDRLSVQTTIDLNNAIVWMFSTSPVVSKSSISFINFSVTVPRSPITIGINVTFMFQSFIWLSLLFTPWEFFTSALADCLSLKWKQVSSSIQDSSQYSDWFQ